MSVPPRYTYKYLEKAWSTEYLKTFKHRFPYFIHSFSVNPNITCDTINDNLNLNWQWANNISKNPNLTWEFVLQHIDKSWNWWQLTRHPNIKLETILNNIEYDWDWHYLSNHPNLTWKMIISKQLYYKSLDWYVISKHQNITWDIIKNNQSINNSHQLAYNNFKIKWDHRGICQNKNITVDIINRNEFKQLYGNVMNTCPSVMFSNPNITWEIILQHYKNPWEWYMVYTFQDLTWDILKLYIDKNWNWELISRHPNILLEHAVQYPDKSWDWELLQQDLDAPWDALKQVPDKHKRWDLISQNNTITWDIVSNSFSNPWDWYQLSKHKCITWDLITNPKYGFRPEWISLNPNITEEIVIKYNLSYDWNWKSLSQNPNISCYILQQIPHKTWDIPYLTKHEMKNGKHNWIIRHRLHIIKTFVIQRYWRYWSFNPVYKFARKRICDML